MIAKTLNENVNANIAFEDVDLSLFKSFPQAHVTIDKLSIINKAPLLEIHFYMLEKLMLL